MSKTTCIIAGLVAIICVAALVGIIFWPVPRFEVSSLKLSPERAFIGQNVTVSAEIRNVGNAEGSYKVSLVVDNVEVEAKDIPLLPGETKIVNFTLRIDVAGKYTVKIGDQTAILEVKEGNLNLINVYWTVNGVNVTSCELGKEVVVHVVFSAIDGPVSARSITVKIRKDIADWFDEDFTVVSFNVSLSQGESAEYTLAFQPDQLSEGSLRGYFVEIEGDFSWTMPNTYPPRLTVVRPEPKSFEEKIKNEVDTGFLSNVKNISIIRLESGVKVEIVYGPQVFWDAKSYVKSAMYSAVENFEAMFTEFDNVTEVRIVSEQNFTDIYGHTETEIAIIVGMNRETAEKIDWKGFRDRVLEDWTVLVEVADEFYIHPAILKDL